MPGTQSNTRDGKKRVELVTAMDTLSSHLNTTFVALSDAYAQSRQIDACHPPQSNQPNPASQPLARTHMAFVVGPSVGAAKARVLLVLDGLEVRPRDILEDPVISEKLDPTSVSTKEDEGDAEPTGEHVADKDTDSDNESNATEPPPSRTPSPSPPPSCPSSPCPPTVEEKLSPLPTPETRRPLAPLSSQRSTPKSMPLSDQTYAEGQKLLRAAERLLSRTLASACAEDDGGLSAELSKSLFLLSLLSSLTAT